MEARGTFKQLNTIESIEVTFELDDNTDVEQISNLINKDLDIIIKVHREKRSNDANAYMWVLCNKIAESMGDGMTKEEVYRDAVKHVGVFETLPVKKEAVKRFIESWEHNGTGWVCENTGRSKWEGYENILTYYGSSTYDTKEMSRLIDYVVFVAKELGVETLPPAQLKALKDAWGVKGE